MAFPIENFPHNQIIKKASVKVEELDEDLRILIASFTKKYNGYRLKESPSALREIEAFSNIIAQHIYDYHVDKEDQGIKIDKDEPITKEEIKEIVEEIREEKKPEPVVAPVPDKDLTPDPEPAQKPEPEPIEPLIQEDPEPSNRNEKALYLLLKEDHTSGITRSMLKEKGFDLDKASIRGCRIGSYMLYKEFSETTYHLKKV
jgi:hypothetical protein